MPEPVDGMYKASAFVTATRFTGSNAQELLRFLKVNAGGRFRTWEIVSEIKYSEAYADGVRVRHSLSGPFRAGRDIVGDTALDVGDMVLLVPSTGVIMSGDNFEFDVVVVPAAEVESVFENLELVNEHAPF